MFKLNADGVQIKCRTRPPQFDEIQESGEVAHGDALLRGRHRYFAGFIENGKFHVDFAVVIDGLEHVFV